MEISPISGIRALPVVKIPPADSDVSRVVGTEDSSRPGDDRYTGNGREAAGGQDDGADEIENSVEVQPAEHSTEDGQGPQINFFA